MAMNTFVNFFLPNPPQPMMKYDRNQVLGTGISGHVFSGTFNGENVAVKRILKKVDSKVDSEAVKVVQNREETAMQKLDHLNVLKLIHVQEDDDFKYLILELCVGTVAHYIKGTYKGQMPSEIDGMIQMASGLQYIHSKHLVHRDIKPENVLISPSFVLKISDFGTSRTVTTTSGSFSMTSGPKGTRVYYSPEFLSSEAKSQEEKEEIRANVLIDVFSLGCLFFSYITMGGHPFADGGSPIENQTTNNILDGKKVLNGEKGILTNHYAYAMIDGMTESDVSKRWKLDKVLETLMAQPK